MNLQLEDVTAPASSMGFRAEIVEKVIQLITRRFNSEVQQRV